MKAFLLLLISILSCSNHAFARCIYKEDGVGGYNYLCEDDPRERWKEVQKTETFSSYLDSKSWKMEKDYLGQYHINAWQKTIFSTPKTLGGVQIDTMLNYFMIDCEKSEFFIKQSNWFLNDSMVNMKVFEEVVFISAPPETGFDLFIKSACDMRL